MATQIIQKKVKDLETVTTVNNNDYLLVETFEGTRKASKEAFLKDLNLEIAEEHVDTLEDVKKARLGRNTLQELQEEQERRIGEALSKIEDLENSKPNESPDQVPNLKTRINSLPILNLRGSLAGITADNSVLMDCEFIDEYGDVIFENKKCKLEYQGNSSMSYPKKNYSIDLLEADGSTKFKLKLFEDVEANDGYHLKANYIDASHLRNVVCAKFIHSCYKNPLPNEARGIIDGFPILVYINGVKQGLYTWNLKQHATVYKLDKKNPNHLMYRAEQHGGACSFLAESTGDTDWEERFPKKGLAEDREKLNRMIRFVKDSSDEVFRRDISQYLDLEYTIDYYLHAYVLGACDSLGKNMNLVTYDGLIWYPTFYDLDSTLGMYWNGQRETSPEYRFPQDYECKTSRLWEKLARVFNEEIKARYRELREHHYTEANLCKFINDFTKLIPSIEYDQDLTLWTGIPSKNLKSIYMKGWVGKRLEYMDSMILNKFIRYEIDAVDPFIKVGEASFIGVNRVGGTEGVPTITWSSSNESIVKVEDGFITGIGEGNATITASFGNEEISLPIEVKPSNYEDPRLKLHYNANVLNEARTGLKDLTGQQDDALFNNMVDVDNSHGYIHFNGTNQYAVNEQFKPFEFAEGTPSNFELEFKFKYYRTTTTGAVYCSLLKEEVPYRGLLICYTAGGIKLELNTDTNSNGHRVTPSIEDGSLLAIKLRVVDGVGTWYINNVAMGTKTLVNWASSVDSFLSFGGQYFVNQSNYQRFGKMDFVDFKFYED